MGASIVGFTAASSSSASVTSLVVPMPAGILPGDWLFVAVSGRLNPDAPQFAITGWDGETQVDTQNDPVTGTCGLFLRQATGSESATYTVTSDISTVMAAVCFCVRNAEISTWVVPGEGKRPLLIATSGAASSSTSIPILAQTDGWLDDGLEVIIVSTPRDNSYTVLSGFEAAGSASTGGGTNGTSVAVMAKRLEGATESPDRTVVAATAAWSGSLHIFVNDKIQPGAFVRTVEAFENSGDLQALSRFWSNNYVKPTDRLILSLDVRGGSNATVRTFEWATDVAEFARGAASGSFYCVDVAQPVDCSKAYLLGIHFTGDAPYPNLLMQINPVTGAILNNIDLGLGKSGVYLAVSPNGQYVYVDGGTDSTMRVYDGSLNYLAAPAMYSSGRCGQHPCFTADSAYVYVVHQYGWVSKFRTSDHTRVGNFQFGSVPGSDNPGSSRPTLSSDGAYVYFGNDYANPTKKLVAIATSTDTVTSVALAADENVSRHMAVTSSHVYMSLNTADVAKVSGTTIVSRIDTGLGVGARTVGCWATSDGAKVYVLVYDGAQYSIAVIDTSDDSIITTIFLGNSFVHGAVTPDDAYFVICADSGNYGAIVIDTATDAINAFVSLPLNGCPPLMSPDSASFYVVRQSDALEEPWVWHSINTVTRCKTNPGEVGTVLRVNNGTTLAKLLVIATSPSNYIGTIAVLLDSPRLMSGTVTVLGDVVNDEPLSAEYAGSTGASSVNVDAPALADLTNSGIEMAFYGTAYETTFTPPAGRRIANGTNIKNQATTAGGGANGTASAAVFALNSASSLGTLTAIAANAAVNGGHRLYRKKKRNEDQAVRRGIGGVRHGVVGRGG